MTREDVKYFNYYDHKTLRTDKTVCVWKENQNIYKAEVIGYANLASFDNVEGCLVPREEVYLAVKDGITDFQVPSTKSFHVKTPLTLICSFKGETVKKCFLKEIMMLERLAETPHPNICGYYGCLRGEDGLIEGICLQKFSYSLQDVITGKLPPESYPNIDVNTIVSGVESGLNHIHSLGLVHNDVTPSNIMLDDKGIPSIIDFDTCTPAGARFSGGTPGWARWNIKIASPDNDLYSLELVRKFIIGEYDGMDYRFEEMEDDDDDASRDQKDQVPITDDTMPVDSQSA